ncbi:MAG: Flp pilus assembly protein CpaB [Kiloniellales bacterium]
MNLRTILILSVALIVAAGTAFVARGWLDAQRAALLAAMQQQATEREEAEEPSNYVLVAVNHMPTGHFVQPDDLAWQAWPEETVVDSYVRKGEGTVEAFVGAVVRTPMTPGEPITEARVVRPGDRGFLAAVLEPGMRAVAAKIDATSGVAGFIFPGDRVDVILTHNIKIIGLHPTKKDKEVTRKASETVLRDVRVLAINQSTYNEKGEPEIGKTATLEVTPKQAEMVRATAALGRLSLSLRSLASEQPQPQDDRKADPVGLDERPVAGTEEGYAFDELSTDYLSRFVRRDGRTHTWDAEVSQLLTPPVPMPSVNHQLQVTRGSKTAIVEFTTGQSPFEFLLEDRDKDDEKGIEDLFRDLLKQKEDDEVATAY